MIRYNKHLSSNTFYIIWHINSVPDFSWLHEDLCQREHLEPSSSQTPCEYFHPIWICFQMKAWSEAFLNFPVESKSPQKALWNIILVHSQCSCWIFSSWSSVFQISIPFFSPGNASNTKHRASLPGELPRDAKPVGQVPPSLTGMAQKASD